MRKTLKFKLRLTVGTKLTTAFALVLLIPALVIGSISYETAKSNVGDEIMNGAAQNVGLLNNTIDQFVGDKKQDVDFLASLIQTSNGTLSPEQRAAVLQQTDEFLKLHPEYENVTVATDTGAYTNSPVSQKFPPDYDPRQRPYFQEAMKDKGQVVIDGPFLSKVTNNPVLSISKVTNDGHGVIAVAVSLKALNDKVKAVQIGHSGYAFILDKNKQYVIHPTGKVGESVAQYDFAKQIYAGPTGRFQYAFQGSDKEMVFVTNAATGWKLCATMFTSEVADQAQPIFNRTLLVLLISIVLAGALVVFIVRAITRPLKVLTDVSEQVGAGDLTKRVELKSRDELGQLAESFNTMVNSLRVVISEVSDTAIQLASSSEELTASAEQSARAAEQTAEVMQDLADGSDQQVISISQTSDVVTDMSASVEQIAASAQSVSQTASHAAEVALGGNQAIQKAVYQMDSISSSVNTSAESIKALGAHAEHIGEIVETITAIANQTNLLALNAAIEAARAGEHGRGFSVVADEVRKLAEQSSASAQQISDYITTIQEGITSAVQFMEDGTREVATGIEVVHEAGDSFDRIQHAVQEVAMQIQEVSSAVHHMAESTEQVVNSIDVIRNVTETAASSTQQVSTSTSEQLAAMEEITSSAAALSEMAEELEIVVKRFQM